MENSYENKYRKVREVREVTIEVANELLKEENWLLEKVVAKKDEIVYVLSNFS